MRFVSTKGQSPPVAFREALFGSIAPDGGLYVPESFPAMDTTAFMQAHEMTLPVLGTTILSPFVEEIPREVLSSLLEKAWDFPVPLVKLDDNLYLIELFHGPTHAFKDVGARFMSYAMSHFLEEKSREVTIVVATSGDTGGAVARGFHNVLHTRVMILFPSGRISPLQQKQMTTLGGNITAIEVEGTFDDCQRLVKAALNDTQLRKRHSIATANSLNLGRLLPQMTYFAWGVHRLRVQFHENGLPVVVVPSGNFGNLTAAAYAKAVGVPIRSFVAATNANDGFVSFLRTGEFPDRHVVPTYSSAMDVARPANLLRLQALYRNTLHDLRHDVDAAGISDSETLEEIKSTHARSGYFLDPHTAVGVAAARKARSWMTDPPPILVAATAHPAKFPHVVEKVISAGVPVPPSLRAALALPTHVIKIRGRYSEWKALLEAPGIDS